MDWEARARAAIGREFPPVIACDPVNAPMIRHWCEAMGHPYRWDDAPEAPATMLSCWLSPGPSGARPPGSAEHDATSLLALLTEGGYTDVVGVSNELDLARPVRPGDRLQYTSVLESISDEKRTALGPGRFVGFRYVVRDSVGAVVGTLRFTQFAYKRSSAHA